MPRILIGTFFQETNDFHPNDTVYERFRHPARTRDAE